MVTPPASVVLGEAELEARTPQAASSTESMRTERVVVSERFMGVPILDDDEFIRS